MATTFGSINLIPAGEVVAKRRLGCERSAESEALHPSPDSFRYKTSAPEFADAKELSEWVSRKQHVATLLAKPARDASGPHPENQAPAQSRERSYGHDSLRK